MKKKSIERSGYWFSRLSFIAGCIKCFLAIQKATSINAFVPIQQRVVSFDRFLLQRKVAIDSNSVDTKPKEEKKNMIQGTIAPDQTLCVESKEFPFSMLVNQKELKEAAMIAASNPQVAGILIGGRHGTGKSVMARAIRQLMPKRIERIKGSIYNIHPEGQYGIDSFLLYDLIRRGSDIEELETEEIATPFVNIPLNIMEDSLCGTVDIERSMVSGQTIFSAGLLAKAHRGILYIDDIHLLDDNILTILFDVISNGWVRVEREGLR